ncbi:uncharacterized protein PFL1_03983 [Pseudozyma flocculosa PF-1]|uniref:Uncharacterized protein n=1 Tax=Pseudozyma flocculosa PF-1 TaxID=1277687 RepID=A0A061H9H3_9BASI|nr:uncharacterized protein PFL1_03983 [Pseudozyma flocculosa PF-1]EPQ28680.1 hypothetical protein PFL1_03983 [Pseudozyma flocculosa PF-1]
MSSTATPPPLTVEQKIQSGLDAKARGNDAFTGGDPKAALKHYHTSVLYLAGLDQMGLASMMGHVTSPDGGDVSPVEEGDKPDVPPHKKHLSQTYSNMAACHIKLQNYPRALDAADRAAKADPTNIKAHFRKAQALRLGGSLQQAIDLLKSVIQQHPQAKESLSAELALCEKTLQAKEAQSRNRWKGFLGKKPDVLSASAGEGEGEGEAKKLDKGKAKAT